MEYIQTGLLLLILLVIIGKRTGFTPRVSGKSTKSIIVDSSALIDGRIKDIAESGFVKAKLVIPSSVLRELQYLADKSSNDKRSRARYGLDIVEELRNMESIDVSIVNDGLPGEGGVDERLVKLCKENNAALLTLDFNLNKVATIEDIEVLNINHLAQVLRMNYLPGEKRDIILVQKGDNKQQAVGYLEDGTMVVVEQAQTKIGSSVEVEFTRSIQTQSGRMLFAKIANQQSIGKDKKNQNRRPYKKSTSSLQTAEDSLVKLANKK